MFERLQKPFLTVETGEAYQPVRLTYSIFDLIELKKLFSQLNCIDYDETTQTWNWYWRSECEDLNFSSIDSFEFVPEEPVCLGSLLINKNHLYINLHSFKRACLAVPFFYRMINKKIATIHHADFVNKVFAIDERLTHGFIEKFSEEELETILQQRLKDYHTVQAQCEKASTAEDAFSILSNYTRQEAKKRLPYAERYMFLLSEQDDADVIFLGFYIYLRGRELVAIKRWFGETGYSLADAADETMEAVFGGIGIDLLE